MSKELAKQSALLERLIDQQHARGGVKFLTAGSPSYTGAVVAVAALNGDVVIATTSVLSEGTTGKGDNALPVAVTIADNDVKIIPFTTVVRDASSTGIIMVVLRDEGRLNLGS